MRRRVRAAWLLFHAWSALFFLSLSTDASGAFSLDPKSFSNPTALTDPAVVGPIVRAIGYASDHRAYEGAVPLGTQAGFELSLQAMVTKLPGSFNTALQTAGLGSMPVPVLPLPRLITHKGLGKRVDVGFSWVGVREVLILGFDFKTVIFEPEEGPTWAIRLNYTTSEVDYENSGAYLRVKSKIWKPELLFSQKFSFAETYLGIGYQHLTGNLSVRIPLAPLPVPDIDTTCEARGNAGIAFIGLALKPENLSLRLTLDGQYSTAGAHSLGAKFGLAF